MRKSNGCIERLRQGFLQPGLCWLLACLIVSGLLTYRSFVGYGQLRAVATGRATGRAKSAALAACTKRIEDVQVGDYVLAKDPDDAEPPKPHRVVATPRNTTGYVYHVEVRNDGGIGSSTLEATGAHPFWVHGRGWTPAQDLVAGDRLTDNLGRIVPVGRVWREQRRVDTFNLTVEGVHTYYVLAGARPILVHNVIVVTPSGQAIVVQPNAISMDQAVDLAIQHAGPGATMGISGSGSYQFVGQPYVDPATGNTMRNVGRPDINLNSRHVQDMGGPHLNREVQINGRPDSSLDPHTPIDPRTIRQGDCP